MATTTNPKTTIRAVLDGNRILVCGDAESAQIIAQLPGVSRPSAKLPPGARHMALRSESIITLHKAGIRGSRELIDAAKPLMAAHRYVEAQKNGAAVTPLRPIPLRPEIKPFGHQVRAFNIALALFGYPTGEGDAV